MPKSQFKYFKKLLQDFERASLRHALLQGFNPATYDCVNAEYEDKRTRVLNYVSGKLIALDDTLHEMRKR